MNAPEEIHNVSLTIFSIARYYGGAKFQGRHYVYDPTRDVLIRSDVLAKREKEKREAKAAERKASKEKAEKEQGTLFE